MRRIAATVGILVGLVSIVSGLVAIRAWLQPRIIDAEFRGWTAGEVTLIGEHLDRKTEVWIVLPGAGTGHQLATKYRGSTRVVVVPEAQLRTATYRLFLKHNGNEIHGHATLNIDRLDSASTEPEPKRTPLQLIRSVEK